MAFIPVSFVAAILLGESLLTVQGYESSQTDIPLGAVLKASVPRGRVDRSAGRSHLVRASSTAAGLGGGFDPGTDWRCGRRCHDPAEQSSPTSQTVRAMFLMILSLTSVAIAVAILSRTCTSLPLWPQSEAVFGTGQSVGERYRR